MGVPGLAQGCVVWPHGKGRKVVGTAGREHSCWSTLAARSPSGPPRVASAYRRYRERYGSVTGTLDEQETCRGGDGRTGNTVSWRARAAWFCHRVALHQLLSLLVPPLRSPPYGPYGMGDSRLRCRLRYCCYRHCYHLPQISATVSLSLTTTSAAATAAVPPTTVPPQMRVYSQRLKASTYAVHHLPQGGPFSTAVVGRALVGPCPKWAIDGKWSALTGSLTGRVLCY